MSESTAPQDPFPDDLFVGAPMGDKVKGIDCEFAATPEEVKLLIDQTKEKQDAKSGKKVPDAPDAAEQDALERYLAANGDQRFLIRTIQRVLFIPPARQFDASIGAIIEAGAAVEEYKEHRIIKVPLAAIGPYFDEVRRAASVTRAARAVPGALLMAFVASFDAFLADFIRQAIVESDEPLSYSDRQLTLRDVISAKSLEELKSDIIDQEVEQVLRDSHLKQTDYIKKVCRFDPLDRYSRKIDYLEIFERRNLTAHGIQKYNDSYCRNLKGFGRTCNQLRGARVQIDPSYLRRTLDIFAEFACLCDFAYGVKRHPQEIDERVRSLNSRVERFIASGRHELGVWILGFLLSFEKEGYGEYARKLVCLNLATAQSLMGEAPAAASTLKAYDWSASAEEFQIREAALRKDVDTVVDLMPRFKDGTKLTKKDFKISPVFRPVRDDAKFQTAFEDTFEEPLRESPMQEALGGGDDDPPPIEDATLSEQSPGTAGGS